MRFLILAVALVGCEKRDPNEVTAPFVPLYKICVEGVTYVKIGHGLSVQLDANNKVIPCNVN